MSLDKTRTRTIRPMLTPEGPVVKVARPFQRLIADLFDLGLLAYVVYNVSLYFNIAEIVPKVAVRHSYFILVFYFYFILTILPHHYFGQTLGQFLTGIRVVTTNLSRPSFFKVFARDLLRPTTLIFPTPVLSKKSKAWYDNFLKTTIVEMK